MLQPQLRPEDKGGPTLNFRLGPNLLRQTEHEFTSWSILVPPDVKPEALLRPSFWNHVASRMKPRDTVTAWAEDGSWYAVVVVRMANRVEARVAIVHLSEWDKDEATMALLAPTDAYCYAWKGMRLKHCVFKADHQGKPVGEPIKAEMDSKAEALAWMADYQRNLQMGHAAQG